MMPIIHQLGPSLLPSSAIVSNQAQCDKNHSPSLDIRLFPIVESFARFISEAVCSRREPELAAFKPILPRE